MLSRTGLAYLATTITLTFLFSASLLCFAKEPQWLPALAEGGAPECPEHAGSRAYRSEIVQAKGTIVTILGKSRRDATGCRATAELRIRRGGKTESFRLPEAEKQEFAVVDFSPDGSRLLLALYSHNDDLPELRDVSLTTFRLRRGRMEWHNTWDLFGWKDCHAMVEPQGFLPDGRVVIRARQSTWVHHPGPDCVNDVGLYAADLAGGKVTRLPDSTVITRYGKQQHPAFQACKSDPDIVGECFAVHGRLSFYNGTPSWRIWKVGTHRMLGVQDAIMPESLVDRLDWEMATYGDFLVCPFAHQRAGEMQMICIEAAEHIVTKRR